MPEPSIEENCQLFGLQKENSNERRCIYSIQDMNLFFEKGLRVLGAEGYSNQIRELFDQYPQGLKQVFIKKSAKTEVLGKHYHTDVDGSGGHGTGNEIFFFTDVPSGSSVKTEQYALGSSRGEIRYGVSQGEKVVNRPNEYHVFTITGPVSFVQVLESPVFHDDDLTPFRSEEWSPEDNRMVNGTLVHE